MHQSSHPRVNRVLIAAIVPAIAPAIADAATPSRLVAPVPTITAFPLNAPPINGFVPRVVFGLTSEQDPNTEDFTAIPSSSPSGTKYPNNVPKYFVATFDTGSSSHIVSYDDAQQFVLGGPPSRFGNYEAELAGASGTEFADITDALGIYMTGLGNATGGANIGVTPGTLKGQWNTSILTAQDGSVLPNIIGSPMMTQYQTVIRTSVPRTITHGANTYYSPDVSFQARDTPLPANYSRLTFDVMSPNGVAPNPVFIPSLENFQNFADNPTTPTFWMTLFANVNVSEGTNSANDRQFLFDTGAQITVFSQDTAAECGFYSAGENPSEPEFTVEILGVGGITQAPGFYLDTLRVITNGGPMVWTRVPVVVLDVIDPRDGIGFVPGIMGMNLFTDRDLILNGGLTNPSVGISPQQQWAQNSGGNWTDTSKWILNSPPNSVDRPANFLGKITAPQTVNVNANVTAGSINFDNANRYTLSGTGRITLQTSEGAAGISVITGSHTISAPMTFASDTSVLVLPPASKLTISSDVIATGRTITKDGAGTLEMKNVRATALEIDAGTIQITPLGNSSSVSVLNDLSVSATGKLDLKNNNLVIRTGPLGTWNGTSYEGAIGLVQSGRGDGSWNGSGVVTSVTTATTGVLTTIAIATAEDIGVVGGTWSGQSIGAGNILVMYTWGGDADLNGVLNGDDYFFIDSSILQSGSVFGFHNGDFDYNGEINGDDYFILDSNILQAQGSAPFYSGAGANFAAVPEPASIGITALALAASSRRRRRLSQANS